MMRELIGRDPRRIEAHWQTLYRGGFYRGGPVLTSALSGIEQALWDILGKHLGVPVHQLLGGRVRAVPGQVMQFVGVGFQVKQQGRQAVREDVFPGAHAHHARGCHHTF